MSWAEDIQKHRDQKTAAPELPQIKRFVRKNPQGRVHEERDFNIVTNNVGNVEKASRLRDREDAKSTSHVNKAVEKHLTNAYHGYNIITMTPVYGISEESCHAMRGNQEPRGKKMAHMMSAVAEQNERRAAENEEALKIKTKKPKDKRETNIISHRYVKDHEERKAAEESKQRTKVEAIAANTNEFNPLTGRYYKQEQETLAQAEHEYKEKKKKEEVQDHTFKTSGIVERSEGHAFDIVTNNVYNKEKVLTLEQQHMKGIPQRAGLRLQWDYQRDVEEAVRDADVNRALNRMSNERSAEVQRRGYNVLSNEPLKKSATYSSSTSSMKAKDKPVLERLHDAMESKGSTTTDVLRESGPRTTNERIFQSSASAVASHVSSFNGRQELLVPSLNRALGQPLTGFAP